MHTTPAILALGAPRVPSTEANGGLNWSDLYEDPQATIPVQVVMPAGNEIQLGDRIDLEWQDRILISKVVDDAAMQARIVSFLVKATDIIQFGDGLHAVKYTVTAIIGGSSSTSPERPVRVKTLVPGGTDPDAGTPYINEGLPVPTGIPDMVDDATQSLIVTVPAYLYMDKDDVVTLDWGGQRLMPSPDLVVGQPVSFIVTRDVLEASVGKVIVRYEVRDVVNNWSRWSPQKDTDVEVGDSFLQAPRANGAGVVNGEVDLSLLGSNDLTVDIPVYTLASGVAGYSVVGAQSANVQPFMEVGDVVGLTWSGRTADGTILPDVLVRRTVGQGDIGWPLSLQIPNDQVKLIASGYATMRYTVTPAVGPLKYSRRANVPVIGEVQVLPPPLVKQAIGSILDPDLLPDEGATLLIDSSGLIADGDYLHLLWSGTTAAGAPLVYTLDILITASMIGKPIERFVDRNYIDPLINGSAEISYTLNKGNGPVLSSPKVTLQIKSASSQLPAPSVDFTVGDTLDPVNVPANGLTVRVNYTPMTRQEIVEIHWEGATSFTDEFTIPSSWGNREIPFSVAKSVVQANLNQTVQVYYTVTLNGNTRTSLSQPLAIQSGGSGDITEDFAEHDADLISAGGSIKTRYMTVRFVSGTGQAGFVTGYVLPGAAADYFVNPVLQLSYQANGNQTIQLEPDTECQSVSFDVHGVAANSTSVRYLDANKNELSSQILPMLTNQQIAYTSPGNKIGYIEITNQGNDWTLWDNFVMKI